MTDYQKYINALRKCAKEHDNDITLTGYIIVSDLCRDTANLLELLEQEPITDRIEYGTDGNSYKLTISNGKEFKQEPKTGHWEWVQYDGNPNIRNWHCSECGRIVSGAITAVNPVYTYKYCPNCGARMKVDE